VIKRREDRDRKHNISILPEVLFTFPMEAQVIEIASREENILKKYIWTYRKPILAYL
jgi:hypothetical protein